MFQLHEQLAKDTAILGDFPLSRVLLHRDGRYPWCLLVPRRGNVREVHHLSEDDRIQLIKESCHLSEIMVGLFAPDKMNVASLGNIVPQLHLHHVARFKEDAVWPGPVWGVGEPQWLEPEALNDRVDRFRNALAADDFTPPE